MRTSILAALAILVSLSPSARAGSGPEELAARQKRAEAAIARADAAKRLDKAIESWENNLGERIRRVERECLGSPLLKDIKCAPAGPYGLPFARDPNYTFDKAEDLIPVAMLFKDFETMGSFAANELTKGEVWLEIFANAFLGLTDSEEWKRQNDALPYNKLQRAMGRGERRYNDLKAYVASNAGGLSDDAKIALAACISARGFDTYNEREAQLVKEGKADKWSSARRPWQSFVSNYHPAQQGKGVCRDYAAVARDFLIAMGFKTGGRDVHVVGSLGHAMTEISIQRGEGKAVFLIEPQHNALDPDIGCRLWDYSK